MHIPVSSFCLTFCAWFDEVVERATSPSLEGLALCRKVPWVDSCWSLSEHETGCPHVRAPRAWAGGLLCVASCGHTDWVAGVKGEQFRESPRGQWAGPSLAGRLETEEHRLGVFWVGATWGHSNWGTWGCGWVQCRSLLVWHRLGLYKQGSWGWKGNRQGESVWVSS